MKRKSITLKAAQKFRLWPEETVCLETFFDKDYSEQERYAINLGTTVEELSELINHAIDRYGCRVPAAQADEWKAIWKADGSIEDGSAKKAFYVLLAAISLVETTLNKTR